ncbi:hypothetical protein HMPREF9628_02317, partial [Peptoanaerobacter stomatis]
QYSAQKIWQNAAKNNQNKVDVTLYAVKAGNKEEVQKLTITGNAEVQFDEVNKYGEDGEEIKYTVEESNPSIASQMVGNPIVDGTKYIFTNKVDDSAADKVQYSAQKIWQNAAKNNQNKVDVTLYAVKAGNKEEVQKLTITGNAEVQFDEVNKYGEDGEEIKYTVEESNPSIASQMVGNPIVDGTKYIFTNKVDDSAADKVQYSAQKIWQNAAKNNQNKVDVTLY